MGATEGTEIALCAMDSRWRLSPHRDAAADKGAPVL
jgi:hypothetical protein